MGRQGRIGSPSSPAAAAGASDHGALTGLGDNDHPQYATDTDLSTHEADTTAVHGITDTSALETAAGAQTKVDTHVNDASAAHAATAISASSTTLVGTATDVQGVLEELDNGIADHLADTSAAHAASAVAFTPVGSVAATDVQAAIAEMLSEGITQIIQVPFSKQGAVAVTTDGTALRWYNRTGRTLTFTMVDLAAVTAPTGAAILVDVNVDGTTIFSTQGNRPTIAISANEGNTTTFNTATVADGHYITVNIDQIGSTVAGSDLSVVVWMKG